jgi:hypothetical protein
MKQREIYKSVETPKDRTCETELTDRQPFCRQSGLLSVNTCIVAGMPEFPKFCRRCPLPTRKKGQEWAGHPTAFVDTQRQTKK